LWLTAKRSISSTHTSEINNSVQQTRMEKLVFSQRVIPRVTWSPKVHYRVHRPPASGPCSKAVIIQLTPLTLFLYTF